MKASHTAYPRALVAALIVMTSHAAAGEPTAQPEPRSVALPSVDASSTLDQLVAYAWATSPEVRAAEQRWLAAQARPAQEGSLPDPKVDYMLDVTNRIHEQEIVVMQGVPWPGKLDRRRDAASLAADSEERRVEAVRQGIRQKVADAYYELAYLSRAIAITNDALGFVSQSEQAARAQYLTKTENAYAKLLQAQVERARIENDLATLIARIAPERARLNAALGRNPADPVPTNAQLPDTLLDADDAHVLARLREKSPALAALASDIASRQASERAARLESYPDLEFGVGGDVTEETVIFRAAITIPLWDGKNKARVREAVANRLLAAHEREAAINDLEAATSRLLFEHRDAHRKATLLEHVIIPKADEAVRSTLACCGAGTATLLESLDTQRTLLSVQLEHERARADRAQALAALEAIVGEPLPTRTDDPPATPEGASR
ncbi:MAG: TolC family protein [Phycisphaerales bacterium]